MILGIMPRRLRHPAGGYVYQILNRAVGLSTLFRKAADYLAFRHLTLYAPPANIAATKCTALPRFATSASP